MVDVVKCFVTRVKVERDHGPTADVVLVDGVLHVDDRIVLCGIEGPVVTTIWNFLTPLPLEESLARVPYLHHEEIKHGQSIKIAAEGLEYVYSGSRLYVVRPQDDLEAIKEAAKEYVKSFQKRIDEEVVGSAIRASTQFAAEELLKFLTSREVDVPISSITIGPVLKQDVMKVGSVLERKELATILAFGVEVTPEAQQLSDELGVNIFTADTLNNLCRMFKSYIDILKGRKKREAYEEEVVFPCVVKILDTDFDANDRFALRIDVLEGIAKVGNPLCIPQRGFINVGRIAAIRDNDKPVDLAKKGQVVTIKIVGTSPEEQQIEFGRHFKIDDVLVSHISRRSIDVLKAFYRDDLSPEEWRLVNKLKCIFKIP